MPRKKLTVTDMMAQPYYRSIMTLTNEFQGSDEYLGLEQIHYRFALQKKPDMPDHYHRKMKNFFGKDLEKLFKQSDILEERGLPRRIFRNCIPEGSHLSFYLKNLIDKGILEKTQNEDGKVGYTTYYVYYIVPVDTIFKGIKERISPLALEFIYTGEPNIGNLDEDRGTMFQSYFIGIDEVYFNPTGKFKKEFEQAMHKFEDGIYELGEFLRKNTKPTYKKNKMGYSHKYGLYLDLTLLDDDGIKALLRI